jgi:hypothetical protein
MKADQWPGLVTNASPFIIPFGSAVEQTNLTGIVPGEVSSRDGMCKVAVVGNAPSVLDCYAYESQGKSYLISLLPSGQLVALESPAYGDRTGRPSEPQITATGSQVATAYTYRYVTSSSSSVGASPPTTPTLVGALDGGTASTTTHPYYLDANAQCSGSGKLPEADGGSAADSDIPPSIPLSSLCAS